MIRLVSITYSPYTDISNFQVPDGFLKIGLDFSTLMFEIGSNWGESTTSICSLGVEAILAGHRRKLQLNMY
jgi:hypothetical protein